MIFFKTKLQLAGWIFIVLGLWAQFSYAGQPPAQYSTNGPGGVGTLTPPMTPYVNSYALAANTAESITWPAGALWANISAPSAFWVRVGGTATVPATDITDGTASMLNPAQRMKGPETSFSIISATNQQISVEFWGSNMKQFLGLLASFVLTASLASAGVLSGGVLSSTSGGSGGGGGTPGGSDTEVQFNDAGSFGGDAGLTYIKATDALTAAGLVTGGGFTPSSSTATGNRLYLPAANTLGWAINGSGEVQLTATALSPVADGGNSLGITNTNEWQNIFLNTGSVINWENGDLTLTHAANTLTFAGGDVLALGNTTATTYNGQAIFTPTNDSTATGASFGIGTSALSGQSGSSAAYNNVAIGYQTMTGTLTTAGIGNTAIGFKALNAMTTGSLNVAIGWDAMLLATTTFQNVVIGALAGDSLTTSGSGTDQVIIGYAALNSTAGQSQSVYIGSAVASSITTASTVANNVFIGGSAASAATVIGEDNVVIGQGTLNNNSTTTATDKETLIGKAAGQFLSTGASNTCVGYNCLLGVTGARTTGASNTAIGATAGLAIQGAANSNTIIGSSTGDTVTTGANNTILGFSVGGTTLTTGSNNILIGVSAAVDTGASSTSNTFKLGGTGTAVFATTGTDGAAPLTTDGGPTIVAGTKFTVATCGDTTIGGSAAGTFQSTTTGSCVAVITISGATGATAPNGWVCNANNQTTPANPMIQTASTATTATLTGTTVDNDVISFSCVGY